MDLEQFKAMEYSDVPRQNMEAHVTKVNDTKHSMKESPGGSDDMVTKTTDNIEDLKRNISMASDNADDARIKMELIQVKVEADVQQANIDLDKDSKDQMHSTSMILKTLKRIYLK